MKLYDGLGPNPRMVRMFAAEKGIDLDKETVDLMAAENRQEAHLGRNPSGQLPTLQTDEGDFISEITVICEYLEEKNPSNPLIGANAEQRAETRMWTRKVDLNICEPLGNGFRSGEGFDMFKDRIPVFKEASEPSKKVAQHYLNWLDKQIEGKEFICGDRLSMADILLFCFLDFAATVGQGIDPDLKNIVAWHAQMAERPSASA